MTVYSAVYMYGGIITEMKVFSTLEAARQYFHEVIDSDGKIEDCDPDFYNDGENGYFYWDDGFHNDNEIHIWPVIVEN